MWRCVCGLSNGPGVEKCVNCGAGRPTPAAPPAAPVPQAAAPPVQPSAPPAAGPANVPAGATWPEGSFELPVTSFGGPPILASPPAPAALTDAAPPPPVLGVDRPTVTIDRSRDLPAAPTGVGGPGGWLVDGPVVREFPDQTVPRGPDVWRRVFVMGLIVTAVGLLLPSSTSAVILLVLLFLAVWMLGRMGGMMSLYFLVGSMGGRRQAEQDVIHSFEVADAERGARVQVTLLQTQGPAAGIGLRDRVRVWGRSARDGTVTADRVEVYEAEGSSVASRFVEARRPFSAQLALLTLAGGVLFVLWRWGALGLPATVPR